MTDVQNVQSTVGGRVAVYTTVLSGSDCAAITESNSSGGGRSRFRTKTRLGTSLFSLLLLNAFDRGLLALVRRRVGHKVAVQVDPEGVVQPAYCELFLGSPKPTHRQIWTRGLLLKFLIS